MTGFLWIYAVCSVQIRPENGKMQRCPYLHEMKERLLGEQTIIGAEPLNTRSSNDHLHHDTTATTTPAHVPAQPPHPPPPLPQPHVMESQPQQQQPVGTVVRVSHLYT